MKLIALKTKDGESKGNIAFYCRVLHVSRQGFYQYLANKDRPWKYQSLADAMLEILSEDECIEVGQLMQRMYHSWTELYDSYLKGYKEWRMKQGDGCQKDIQEREDLCLKLRNDLNGPCSLPWDLRLF